jgi:hypothetical protein
VWRKANRSFSPLHGQSYSSEKVSVKKIRGIVGNNSTTVPSGKNISIIEVQNGKVRAIPLLLVATVLYF